MAESSNDFEKGNPTKRIMSSRKNTTEERRRQRQEWRKKKQEQKMANLTSSIPMPGTVAVQQEGDLLVPKSVSL